MSSNIFNFFKKYLTFKILTSAPLKTMRFYGFSYNNDIIEEFRPYLRKLHKQAKREGWL